MNKRVLMAIILCSTFSSNFLFVLGSNNIVKIDLIEIGHVETNGQAITVYVEGDLVFILDPADYNPEGLVIINVSDPYNPEKISSYYDGGLPYDVLSKDFIVYVADGEDGVEIFNISNPANPIKIASYDDGGMSTDLELVDDLLFVADWFDGLEILNVSNPQTPIEIAQYSSYQLCCVQVSIENNIACITDHKDSYTSIRLLDISNPLAITTLDTYSPTNIDFWDPKIYGNFVYSGNHNLEGEDIYIINITNPSSIQELNSFSIGSYTHSIFLQNNIAYLADYEAGVNIINITDPMNPVKIGNFYDGGHSKDIHIENDLIFVANIEDGLEILQQTFTTVRVNANFTLIGIISLVGFIVYLKLTKNYIKSNCKR